MSQNHETVEANKASISEGSPAVEAKPVQKAPAQAPKAKKSAKAPKAPKRYIYSTPSFKLEIMLCSEEAKRLGGQVFDTLSSSLFIIDVMSRKMAEKSKSFNHKAITTAVASLIDGITDEIQADISRLSQFLDSQGINDRPSYSNPLKRKYEATSPEIRRFADLVVQFDTLIQLIDTAWLSQLLSSEEAADYRKRKAKALGSVVRKLINHGMAAKQKAYASSDEDVKTDIEAAEAKVAAERQEREDAGFVEAVH